MELRPLELNLKLEDVIAIAIILEMTCIRSTLLQAVLCHAVLVVFPLEQKLKVITLQ